MSVYIAGPVVRQKSSIPRWVVSLYDDLMQLRSMGIIETRYPHPDRFLDDLGPKDFAAGIMRRIREADNVVAAFLPGDPSVPVETAMASFFGKRVLLVHNEASNLPRVLTGLRLVTVRRWEPDMPRRIMEFVKREYPGPR